jgi:hypothetical protein
MAPTVRILLACLAMACATGCLAVPGRQEKCPWPPSTVSAPQDAVPVAAADAEPDACG